jgi:hypothetical protein
LENISMEIFKLPGNGGKIIIGIKNKENSKA